jgi:hypothetical protein
MKTKSFSIIILATFAMANLSFVHAAALTPAKNIDLNKIESILPTVANTKKLFDKSTKPFVVDTALVYKNFHVYWFWDRKERTLSLILKSENDPQKIKRSISNLIEEYGTELRDAIAIVDPDDPKSKGLLIKKPLKTSDVTESFLKSFTKNVLNFQFNPINPKLIIGPGKIHRVKVRENCEVWKVEMSVKGLRKNQSPRIWLAVAGDTLAFLTIKTHIDNYDDNEVNRFAENLSTDIF